MPRWRRSWPPARRVEELDSRGYNSRAVKDHDNTPLETVVCGRCATLSEPDDNFCRQCGLPLTEQHLPSVRSGQTLPAVWKPRVRGAMVKSAAFVAAGTLAEAVLRRLVRRALGRASSGGAVARRGNQEGVVGNGTPSDDADYLTDTILLRHTRIRR